MLLLVATQVIYSIPALSKVGYTTGKKRVELYLAYYLVLQDFFCFFTSLSIIVDY